MTDSIQPFSPDAAPAATNPVSSPVSTPATSPTHGATFPAGVGSSSPADACAGADISPLLEVPGACPLPEDVYPAAHRVGVPWHYGDPLGEQRAPVMVIDRSAEDFLTVAGPDAATFINSLFSQKLDDLTPGISTQALNLDAQGHVLEHISVTVVADGFVLSAPAPQLAAVEEYLRRMVFWNQVTITRAPLALISVIANAPDALPAVLAGLGNTVDAAAVPTAQLAEDDWSNVILRDGLVGLPGVGFGRPVSHVEVIAPRAALAATVDALVGAGGHHAGMWAFEAFRVAQGLPVVGVDTDERTIPHEVPVFLNSAVHLNKGCYRGQETVARVHNVGRSPRLLVRLLLDGSAPQQPNVGEPVLSGGRTVGRVGTVIDDWEWGPVALATVKRSALNAGSLSVGDVAATIDADSVVVDEAPQAGRVAQARLRGKEQ